MRLRSQEVRVQAPQELLFDVIASAGKVVGEDGGDRLVEFDTEWKGRSYKTTEAVSLRRPDRIGYRWVTGPLAGAEEEITLSQIEERVTVMRYRGTFEPPTGLTGWIRSVMVIRPIFNKLVSDHLDEAKQLAEARAERSRIYPRT